MQEITIKIGASVMEKVRNRTYDGYVLTSSYSDEVHMTGLLASLTIEEKDERVRAQIILRDGNGREIGVQVRDAQDVLGDWVFVMDSGDTCTVHVEEKDRYQEDLENIEKAEKAIINLSRDLDSSKYNEKIRETIRQEIRRQKKLIMDIHRRYIRPDAAE